VIGAEVTLGVEARKAVDGPADDVRTRAFDALVDRHTLDGAYRLATLILGSRTEAEDVTHDAALTAWRRFGELRDPGRFEAWFGRILVNACRDRLRARRRLPVSIPDGTRHDAAANAAGDPTEAIAGRQALAAAVRSLSPEHREVLALRFYADLTVEQIAGRTGLRAGTVKSRLHHALRYLRAAYEAGDEGGTRWGR
jgi:RNA polymerase sigma-70 factor (ECF subfamily)